MGSEAGGPGADDEMGRPAVSEWDEYASTWDQDEAAKSYARAAFGSLESELAARGRTLAGASVCDFGCGTGLLTEYLAPTCATVDAVDTSPAMLAELADKAERNGWTHVRPNGGIDATGPQYDLIVASSVCSFLPDYPATVRELVARLKPDGLFVQWDWERAEGEAEEHGLTVAEIRSALADAGLVSVTVRTAFETTVEGQTMSPLMGVGEGRRSA